MYKAPTPQAVSMHSWTGRKYIERGAHTIIQESEFPDLVGVVITQRRKDSQIFRDNYLRTESRSSC